MTVDEDPEIAKKRIHRIADEIIDTEMKKQALLAKKAKGEEKK